MRALLLSLLLACLAAGAAADVPKPTLPPAEGDPDERVLALWQQTRPILLADAGLALSDAQALARGAGLIEVWTGLEAQLAATAATGETHAVLKLLNDFYGRPGSTPERRMAIRNQTRLAFAQRVQNVEQRLLR